jgi:protein O-mannosyl-transferase
MLLLRSRWTSSLIYIQPDFAVGYGDIGTYLVQTGQPDAAIEYFQKALKMETNDPVYPYNLGNVYSLKGQPDVAIRYWENAVAVDPDFAPAHNALGDALSAKSQTANAIHHWRSALASEPDLVPAQVNLAWALATCTQATLRNGTNAVALAKRANELTGSEDPTVLKTLAAADAERGDFPGAITMAQQAAQIANRQQNLPLANAIERQMELYQNNQPYRESASASLYH